MEPKTNEGENEAPKRCSACEKENSALKKVQRVQVRLVLRQGLSTQAPKGAQT